MRRILGDSASFVILAAAFIAFSAMAHAAAAEDAAKSPQELRVLYAGNPGSERMEDFKRFLGEHFAAVETTSYEEVTPESVKGFDVLILDWTSVYPRDEQGKIDLADNSLAQPTPPKLDRTFDRPTLMIGVAAGTLANQLQIAINWKCLCLENYAHDTNTEHPIFQGPLPVEIELVEREKPFDYFTHPGTKRLGEKHLVWKVQERSFPEVDPGLVSTRESFVKTPDAEIISGGVNGKGPTSVAIGRHGNFLLWGFSGEPSEMTEPARSAFVNAVCYIERFDGQAPGPVDVDYGGPEALLTRIYQLRMTSDEYVAVQAKKMEQMLKDNPPPAEMLEQMGDDPAAYMLAQVQPYVDQIREQIPENIRDRFNNDTEQIIQYYTDHADSLRIGAGNKFQVDDSP